jgi:hypothetical protein
LKLQKKKINDYFKDLVHLIKKVIITDDANITLIGNTRGYVSKTKAPLIGWKKYWYGKYEIISYLNSLFENNNEVVINCRFDVLSNSHSFNNNEIINFIETNKNNNLTKNLFINNNNKPFCGMDNIYLGTIETQYKLISHFHNNLDMIFRNNSRIGNQEFLVFFVNNRLF